MSLGLSKYLKDLRNEAHRFERTDINNKVSTSFWSRNQRRILCLIPTIAMLFFLKEGFSTDFVMYASTALSILIGLFTTAIIFIVDKYRPIENENPNSREKLHNNQAYNYTKQFANITGYNIVLCVFALVALAFSALFEKLFSMNICQYYFYWHDINFVDSAVNVAVVSAVITQRFLVLYWLASIVYNTLYAISSMVKYITVKIDRTC